MQHPDVVYYAVKWRQTALRREAASRSRAARVVLAPKPARPRQWALRCVAMLMPFGPDALAVEP